MKNVVVVVGLCLATIIWMSASGACAASGLSLELRYWVPSVDGADEVAWYRILWEQYADWSSEPAVYWEHETGTPYTLSPGRARTCMIEGALALAPQSSVCFSRWGISASGSVGSPSVPVECDGAWVEIWGALRGNPDDYYYDGTLANDYEYYLYGDMTLVASSTDLLYERQVVVTPGGRLGVVAGLRHGALVREQATHFEGHRESYPHSSQGYPEGSYSSTWDRDCVSSRVSFSLLGPEVGISADAALFKNIRLSGRLAYSVLFGKAHQSGCSTSEVETKCYGGLPPDDYEESRTYDVKRAVDTSVPVLDADIGLCCSLSDSIEVFAGYMASTWLNVPEPPSYNAALDYGIWDLSASGAVSFRGFTVGATVRF